MTSVQEFEDVARKLVSRKAMRGYKKGGVIPRKKFMIGLFFDLSNKQYRTKLGYFQIIHRGGFKSSFAESEMTVTICLKSFDDGKEYFQYKGGRDSWFNFYFEDECIKVEPVVNETTQYIPIKGN